MSKIGLSPDTIKEMLEDGIDWASLKQLKDSIVKTVTEVIIKNNEEIEKAIKSNGTAKFG